MIMTLPRAVNERLRTEAERLSQSWTRHDAQWLREYLATGIHDPHLNVQSILGRHFLIEALFADRFALLQEEELRYAAVMNWLLRVFSAAADLDQVAAIQHALAHGADDAEGLAIPRCVARAFAELPQPAHGTVIPNYVRDFLLGVAQVGHGRAANTHNQGVFQTLWQSVLAFAAPQPLRVLEPACGSANDYRAFASFGLARLIDYTGFDLCEKNVANARRMFPGARFEHRNVFDTGYPDKAFDRCVVHDLLEHFSLEGLEAAVAELCRVTRQAICIGFFQMHEGEEHVVRPADDYHINTLSLPRLREMFGRWGFTLRAVHINTLLNRRFGCQNIYYDTAYTCTAWL